MHRRLPELRGCANIDRPRSAQGREANDCGTGGFLLTDGVFSLTEEIRDQHPPDDLVPSVGSSCTQCLAAPGVQMALMALRRPCPRTSARGFWSRPAMRLLASRTEKPGRYRVEERASPGRRLSRSESLSRKQQASIPGSNAARILSPGFQP
ncbi:hypothetical protein VTN02DRAFT_626 [Thermoascus thermophilus]